MNGCNGRNSMMKQGQLAAAVLATFFMFVQAQAVHALVVPGGIYSGKDVQLDFSGPTSVNRGVNTSGYATRLTNFDDIDVEENVKVVFEVLGDDTVADGDVFIEIETAAGSGAYIPVPMAPCFSNLCGEFGPQSGFPMGPDYDVTTAFRITFNQAGAYTLRASVVGVASGNQFAGASIDETVVAPIVSIKLTGPETVDRGVQTSGFAAAVDNAGDGAVPERVYLGFEISGLAQLKDGNVSSEIETSPGSGKFLQIPVVVCGLNLCGDFGAAGGFAVAAGYAAASAMRTSFELDGEFVLSTHLIGTESGIDYASGDLSVNVVSNPAAVAISAGQGQTAGLETPVATVPLIRVEDAAGSPVGGASVSFSVLSGGGSILQSSALTDSSGFATPGNWILGSTPGTNELLVEVADLEPLIVVAKAVPKAEISVSISTNLSHVSYGGTQEHVIVVSNGGPSAANSVDLSVPLPQAYTDDTAHWTCFSVNEAKCPAEGYGSIGTLLDLPAGASAIFVVSATVTGGDGDSESVTLHAKASHPDDLTPGNNFASVETALVLTRGGFEAGDPGAGNVGGTVQSLGSLDTQNFLGLDLVNQGQGPMRTVAQGYSDRGARFAIDEIRAGDKRVLLLSASTKGHPTSWSTAIVPVSTTRIAIGLAQNSYSLSQTQLLAVGEGITLDVALDADKTAEVNAVTF